MSATASKPGRPKTGSQKLHDLLCLLKLHGVRKYASGDLQVEFNDYELAVTTSEQSTSAVDTSLAESAVPARLQHLNPNYFNPALGLSIPKASPRIVIEDDND